MQNQSLKIGISLSGGGARGIAHLGVLQALEEMDIYPTQIAGVSAGAIVGAMYAHGYKTGEILMAVQKLNYTTLLRPSSFFKPGLLDMEQLESVFLKYLPHNSFEALKIPLLISATDINEGQTVHFSKGELIKPILASSCIPVLFSPVHYQGRTLVDGGIINSMEVDELKKKCDVVIGIHANPFDKNSPLKSTRSLLERCLTLAIHSNGRANFAKCAVVIEPIELNRITAIDLSKANEIYEIGYKTAKRMESEIKEKLEI